MRLQFGPMLGKVMEGVVVAFRPINDPNNKNKFADEYDVDPIWPGYRRILNCTLAVGRMGHANGHEFQLRPAGKVLTDSTEIADSTPRGDTDGDRVVVQWLHGNPQQPIITGILSHYYADWRTKSDDFKGEINRTRHNGTEVLYDFQGNIAVTLDDGADPSVAGADKTVTFTLDKDTVVTISKGAINVQVKGVQVLNLTDQAAKVFAGDHEGGAVACIGDRVATGSDSDPNFIKWMAAVDAALKGLAALTAAGPLVPVGTAAGLYTAAAPTGAPASTTGKIATGSPKLSSG